MIRKTAAERPREPWERTRLPDGAFVNDPRWRKAEGERPYGLWVTAVPKEPFWLSRRRTMIAIIALLGLVSMLLFAPSRSGLRVTLIVMAVLGGAPTLLLILAHLMEVKASRDRQSHSICFIPPGARLPDDLNAAVEAALEKVGVALDGPLSERLPLERTEFRAWRQGTDLSLTYVDGSKGETRAFSLISFHGVGCEHFPALKGALLEIVAGPDLSMGLVHRRGAAAAMARVVPDSTGRTGLPRSDAPTAPPGGPGWATTLLPETGHMVQDAAVIPRHPEQLPVGWWASPYANQDLDGGKVRRPLLRMLGVALGASLLLALPTLGIVALIDRSLLGVALLGLTIFWGGPLLMVAVLVHRRDAQTWAKCYLRVGLGPASILGIKSAVGLALEPRDFKESGFPTFRPPFAQWMHNKTWVRVILWTDEAAGDPLIELRSNGQMREVIATKSAIVSELYGPGSPWESHSSPPPTPRPI